MQRSEFMRVLASAPLVATVAITASAAVYAQTTTGTVRGIARDEAGKPLRNVTVSLVPTQGEALTSVTDRNGAYVFLGVQPGTYTLKATLETYQPSEGVAIAVTQDIVTTADIPLSKSVTKTGTTTIRVAPVRKGQTSAQTNVSARTEQLVKSQPNALYQFPGLVFGQPGVTFDTGGYVHIHGADYNQVGFQVDGIRITEPIYNGFATNIVTVGLKSANVVTSGADASFGGGSGFINQVTNNGRDIKGGTFEYTSGPGNGWGYSGSQIQYGNVLGNGKFDYFGATILFANKFPNNTQISKLNPSYDGLLKFNYYADPNNTVTLYTNNGREKYYDYQLPKTGDAPVYASFDPKTGKLSYSPNYRQDIAEQRYDFNYVAYKHNFSDRSVLNIKQYSLFNRSANTEETVVARYLRTAATQKGTMIDYSNQLAPNYLLRAGYSYIPSTTDWRQASGIPDDDSGITNGLRNSINGLTDRSIRSKPTDNAFYLTNQFRALQDKATLDVGVRYNNTKYSLNGLNGLKDVYGQPLTTALTDPNAPGYSANDATLVKNLNASISRAQGNYDYGKNHTVKYVDPRIGVSFAPSNTLVFRSSYTVSSNTPDLRRLEAIPTGQLGDVSPTSINPRAQTLNLLRGTAPYNNLGASHTNEFNLGVEKGFNLTGLLGGQYSFALNGFRRLSYDLLQFNVQDWAAYPFATATYAPLVVDNSGHSHSSGADFILNKRLVKKTDWNGFLSYTNLTAKASSSYLDTGYLPYWVNNLTGFPGLSDADYRKLIRGQEVSTSWDQKHTVALVANKRFTKIYEGTLVLDAGSGFPFTGAAGTSDPQHGTFNQGGAIFNQVPVVVNEGGTALNPNAPIAGRTGWHYKFTLNSSFHISEDSSIFFNIDNIFSRKTTTVRAQETLAGDPFYSAPSAQFPQGKLYYGSQTVLTPRFISFGVRTKF